MAAERLLRVGASGTDDASTNRLVKQLSGASIRRRVSRRFPFGISPRVSTKSVRKKVSTGTEFSTVELENACMYISSRCNPSAKSFDGILREMLYSELQRDKREKPRDVIIFESCSILVACDVITPGSSASYM